MKYLLDTCIISELIKKTPSSKVTAWILGIDENLLFLSVLTFGEIYKGIEKIPESKKKDKLSNWINFDLQERFENRIISFDLQVATIWGRIQALSESAGKSMPTIDGQIAATGIYHGLTIVTRNTSDMEISGVPMFNPWK